MRTQAVFTTKANVKVSSKIRSKITIYQSKRLKNDSEILKVNGKTKGNTTTEYSKTQF